VLILGTFYLVLVLLLVLLENWLVYLPRSASGSWSDAGDLIVEDVNLVSADGTAIHGWWIPHDGADGAILFCHGQMGNLSHRGPLLQRIRRLHKPILIFDYPGFGKSEGSPTEEGCYAAADAAYDWLVQERKIPPSKLIILGKSLGGGIAVDLASRREYGALILVMTFTSAPDVGQRMFPFIPAHMIMHNRFDNLAKIGRCTGPVFLAHGTEDGKIPPQHSEQLYEAATGKKHYFPMEGLGHAWPCLTDECLVELNAFLADCGCQSAHEN